MRWITWEHSSIVSSPRCAWSGPAWSWKLAAPRRRVNQAHSSIFSENMRGSLNRGNGAVKDCCEKKVDRVGGAVILYGMQTIGQRVRTCRCRLGWTQDDLAAAVSVDCGVRITRQWLSKLERGGDTSSERAVALAEALGVRLHWLATGRGKPR